MGREAWEHIRSHKNFYRDNFRRGCNALTVALLIILGLAIVIFYIYITRPEPEFYATSSNGNIAPVTPLNHPNYSHEPLIK